MYVCRYGRKQYFELTFLFIFFFDHRLWGPTKIHNPRPIFAHIATSLYLKTMSAEHFSKFLPSLPALHYKKIVKNKKGSNVVYIRRQSGSEANLRLTMNTPDEAKCVTPFGISAYDDSNGSRKSMEISLGTEELVQFFQSLDEHNIQTAITNKETWFKDNISDDQIRAMYYPLVTLDPTDKGYAPRLHTKVNSDPGQRQIRVFEITDYAPGVTPTFKVGTADQVVPYSDTMPIIEIQNIWFQKLQFGMTILTTDVVVFPKVQRAEGVSEFSWGTTPVPMSASAANPTPPTPPPNEDIYPPVTETTLPSLGSILMEGKRKAQADAEGQSSGKYQRI